MINQISTPAVSGSSSSVSLSQVLKDNIHVSKVFDVTYVGKLRLFRHTLNANSRTVMKFHLDNTTALDLCGQATRLGLTTDELLRQVCWKLTEDMRKDTDI